MKEGEGMAAVRMRDGSFVQDIRLGRLPSFDDLSRRFPVTKHPSFQAVIRGRSWWLPPPYMDQNGYPRCVAYAGGNRLKASPVMHRGVTHSLCDELYHEAQERDEWSGTAYDGTSGLGLAKALRDRGLIDAYFWCFTEEQILQAVASAGPVLVGWPWYASMEETRSDGLLEVDPQSGLLGFHEVLIRGVRLRSQLRGVDEGVYRTTNQWGASWGVGGECFVRRSDVRDKLMVAQGDALVVHEVRH